MTYHERDKSGALVPAGLLPQEFLQMAESMDDNVIIQRMTTGSASEAFYYKYPMSSAEGKKEIIGVSVDGADELANMVGNLKTLTMEIRVDKDSDPDYCYAMVPVLNVTRNTVLVGVGRACKFVVGKNNVPQRDKNDDHWFVKAIGKGQRNGILKHIPEEIITQAVAAWSQVKGRSRTFIQDGERPAIAPIPAAQKPTPAPAQAPKQTPPPAPAAIITPPPAQAPALDAVAEAQRQMNLLRIQVHDKFQKQLGISTEDRAKMLLAKIGTGALAEMSVQQLKDSNAYADELIKEKGVSQTADKVANADVIPVSLGFTNAAEQKQLAQALYGLLVKPDGLDLNKEAASAFINSRGVVKSTEATKAKILEMTKEANTLIEVKKRAALAPQQPIDDSNPAF